MVMQSDERIAGSACAQCGRRLTLGERVAVCSRCGRSHHEACWQALNRCGSYECAPARQDLPPQTAALCISRSDLEQAVPMLAVSRPRFTPPPPRPPESPRTSRLAIAAFVCAVAGIPLFGLLTGLVAVLLGALAVGAIQKQNQKGLPWAVAGILLGLADVIGWMLFIGYVLHDGPAQVNHTVFRQRNLDLEEMDPTIGRLLRANVLIRTRAGGWFGGEAIGSGVIMQIKDGEVLILTNRHVVDPKFSGRGSPASERPSGLTPQIEFVDQSVQQGDVIWFPAHGVDLALVRVRHHSKEIMAARWQLDRRQRIGDLVFAMGNPHGLGWTYTQGPISQFRIQDAGPIQVPVIQTQAVINSGNSGGGLYDKDGLLVGINTWAQDKRVSEGLNFSIALEILTKLAPPDLDLAGGANQPD